MNKLILLIAALALSACTTSTTLQGAPPGLQTTEYGCASASAALRAINLNFMRLTAAQRSSVTQAKAITDPICLQTMPPTLMGTAQAAFTGAVASLATAAK